MNLLNVGYVMELQHLCVVSVWILVILWTPPHGLEQRIAVDVLTAACVLFVGLMWETVPGPASSVSSQRMVLTLMKLH